MSHAFRPVIAALWQRLELSRPSFQADDMVTLTVDGISIKLALTEDGGHILLLAKAGELSADPFAREQQVSHLLKANLHTLLSSRACACIDDRASQTPTVMVRAVVPCSTLFVDAIAETISDIAQLAAAHARELGGGTAGESGKHGSQTAMPAPLRPLPPESLSDDMLVFKL